MRTTEGNKVYAIVRRHTGRENAISAPDICRELRWPMSRERLVRRIIADESHLWSGHSGRGILVCAAAGFGYFCAENFEEVHKYRNWIADLFYRAQDKLKKVDDACARMGFRFHPAAKRKAA